MRIKKIACPPQTLPTLMAGISAIAGVTVQHAQDELEFWVPGLTSCQLLNYVHNIFDPAQSLQEQLQGALNIIQAPPDEQEPTPAALIVFSEDDLLRATHEPSPAHPMLLICIQWASASTSHSPTRRTRGDQKVVRCLHGSVNCWTVPVLPNEEQICEVKANMDLQSFILAE